jgi:hypothetical protein
LIDQRAEGILLSTLNYDCLLDGELALTGRGVNYLFAPGGGLMLMKLHGSCNWFIDLPGMNRFVQLSPDIRIEAEMRSASSQDEVVGYLTGDTPLHPVMCPYTPEKPAPLCPSFFEHLQREWTEGVLGARQIAIVGVRPYPSDAHIWEPLAATDAHIWCIGDRGAFDKWNVESGRTAPTTVVGDRFDVALDRLWGSLF